MYIYIYTYIHTCTYIYIYIWPSSGAPPGRPGSPRRGDR